MNKLVMADFQLPKQFLGEMDATWGTQTASMTKETAYQRMQKNLAVLKDYGVITDGGFPYTKVSGWDVNAHPAPNVRNPAAICPGKKLQLLVWGSPSPNSSDNGPRESEHIAYETQAFESIAWLCPIGVVAMPFSTKSFPEFYQPCSDRAAANRILICCRM